MNSENNIETLLKISKNIKFISLLTVVSLSIIILTNFLPMMHWSIELIGKFIALILLMYSIKLNIMNTNDTLSNTKNIFIDPNKHDLKNIVLLSYLFSICIFILIVIIVHSLFYNS
jgi:hypothetical protein